MSFHQLDRTKQNKQENLGTLQESTASFFSSMPKSNFLPLDLSMFFIIRYVHLLKSVLFSALNLKTRVTPLRCKLYESGQFCCMITKIYVFYR